MHHAARAVDQPDAGLAEIELGKLPSHAFEAHQELGRQGGPHLGEQAIDGAQAERRPFLAQPTHDLARRHRGIISEQRRHPRAHWGRHPRTPDASGLARRDLRSIDYGRLAADPLHRPHRHSKLRRDRPGGEPGASQLLDCVPIQHPEHPPLPPKDRDP